MGRMFSIGTFSRLCQLSVRVLRHYDAIGLLTPARTHSQTGYRYYTAEQLREAHRIIASIWVFGRARPLR